VHYHRYDCDAVLTLALLKALDLIACTLAADYCTYRDALSGSKTIAHIHTPQQFRAVQLVRSNLVIQTFAVLCLLQVSLILLRKAVRILTTQL
jgi:hypothetical protein